jgi:hypothetical protein
VSRSELSVGGYPALLFGALEDALTVGIPTVVELTFIFAGPLFHDVVWPVDRAARPIHKERLVRLQGLVRVQPLHGVVRQILAQVIAFLRTFGR